MSKTPRTDVNEVEITGYAMSPCHYVRSEIARQLETELADARAEIERKDKLIEQMREALKLALLYVPDNATDAVRISEAALDAAERGEK